MVAGFTVLPDVAAIADLGGRHNVAPLYIMSYHSFLFKKRQLRSGLILLLLNLRSRMPPEGADHGNLPANGERRMGEAN